MMQAHLLQEIQLEKAEYGVGVDGLLHAMRRWAVQNRNVYFNNISRAEAHVDAPRRAYNNYALGGRGIILHDALPQAPLVFGTALHHAAEALMHNPTNIEDATAKALISTEASFSGVAEMPMKLYDEWMEFKEYAPDLVAAAGPKFGVIDEVWATEELVWTLAPLRLYNWVDDLHEMLWVCIVGRPDAIIRDDDKVWHLQHKTRAKAAGYDAYITKLAFSGHETTYGWILHNTIQRGIWGEENAGAVYGGSKVAMWLKKAKPNAEPPMIQKGLLDLANMGKVSIKSHFDRITISRTDATDKQWEKAQDLCEKYNTREQKRLAELATYAESAIQILPVDLDIDKMELGFRRMLLATFDQWQWRPNQLSLCNTNACERWNRPCVFLESKACGGWDPLDPHDPDGQWVLRPPDYVDDFRKTYESLLLEEDPAYD